MASHLVYDAVRAHLDATWTATPLVFDNEDAAPDGRRPQDGADPWVMVEMTGDFYDQASIGSGNPATDLWREEGLVFMTVMVRAGTGSRSARAYAKQLCDLFRGVELADGTIRFGDASIGLGEEATPDG
ncbi:MAG: phage tail terminator-like protein, partial [Reyranellaceae bacterium]